MKPPLPIPAEAEGHTPLPWALRPADDEHCFNYVEIALERFIIAEGKTLDEANANAALIHHCVTNYAAALERIKALETSVSQLLTWADGIRVLHKHPFLNDTILDNARALLAQQEDRR